jgi:defect-in-organelle-trafficking protein DotD
MNPIIVILIISAMLSGCQTTYKKPPINEPSTDATIQLAEAAVSISDSMYEMAVVEKNIMPHSKTNLLTIPNIPPFQVRASVDWSGPIEEITARIAKAAHYHFHTLGKAPAIPILVNLTVKDVTLVQILRNLDYQAGERGSIHVYPNRGMVELHYAKFYG